MRAAAVQRFDYVVIPEGGDEQDERSCIEHRAALPCTSLRLVGISRLFGCTGPSGRPGGRQPSLGPSAFKANWKRHCLDKRLRTTESWIELVPVAWDRCTRRKTRGYSGSSR